MVQDTESPKKLIRGAAPGLRPIRCMGLRESGTVADANVGGTSGTAMTWLIVARVGTTVAARMNAAVAPTAAVAVAPARTGPARRIAPLWPLHGQRPVRTGCSMTT
jgi:hypothetical protein